MGRHPEPRLRVETAYQGAERTTGLSARSGNNPSTGSPQQESAHDGIPGPPAGHGPGILAQPDPHRRQGKWQEGRVVTSLSFPDLSFRVRSTYPSAKR